MSGINRCIIFNASHFSWHESGIAPLVMHFQHRTCSLTDGSCRLSHCNGPYFVQSHNTGYATSMLWLNNSTWVLHTRHESKAKLIFHNYLHLNYGSCEITELLFQFCQHKAGNIKVTVWNEIIFLLAKHNAFLLVHYFGQRNFVTSALDV